MVWNRDKTPRLESRARNLLQVSFHRVPDLASHAPASVGSNVGQQKGLVATSGVPRDPRCDTLLGNRPGARGTNGRTNQSLAFADDQNLVRGDAAQHLHLAARPCDAYSVDLA